MKKTIITFIISAISLIGFAQSKIPQLVSFSSVVRDANNQTLANTAISIRLTFRQGGQNGSIVYCALYQTKTNQNGFMSLQLNRDVLGIGCNGAPSTSFENIPWENGGYWMKVEYQTTPGTPFIDLGQLELASSFYAFAASSAERIVGFNLNGANDGDIITYNINSKQWEPKQPKNSFSGSYTDLTNKPATISGYGITDAFSGKYADLTNKPTTIAGYGITDAFSGKYTDLTNKPTTIAGYGITDAFSGKHADLTNKPTTIAGYGITDAFSGNYSDLKNKPMEVYPRIASKGQIVSVSFSGGDLVTFSQASNSCPKVWSSASLRLSQGSSTISAFDVYFINDKRFDVIFDIPSYLPSGFYDIILGPNTPCEQTFRTSFKIY